MLTQQTLVSMTPGREQKILEQHGRAREEKQFPYAHWVGKRDCLAVYWVPALDRREALSGERMKGPQWADV